MPKFVANYSSNSTHLLHDMDYSAERRSVVTAVFAATGKKVDEDDPIIVAALFQAYTMREASREAAGMIAEAGNAMKLVVADARNAAAEASTIARQAAADRKALADAVSAQVKRALREAGAVQSSQDGPPTGWRGGLAGIAFGILLTGGAMAIACNFSFSWVTDARLGAQIRRAFPNFDPVVQDKIIQYFQKPAS